MVDKRREHGGRRLREALEDLEDRRRRGLLAEEEYQAQRAKLVSGARDRSGKAGVVSLAVLGVVLGAAMAALAVAANGVPVWQGGSGVAGLLAGLAFASVYYRRWERRVMPWALVVAAFWHLASLSLFGVPGATLLFTAGIVALAGRRW